MLMKVKTILPRKPDWTNWKSNIFTSIVSQKYVCAGAIRWKYFESLSIHLFKFIFKLLTKAYVFWENINQL